MKSAYARLFLTVALPAVALACSHPAHANGSVTALVDGAAFSSSDVQVVRANGTLQLTATGQGARVLLLQSGANVGKGAIPLKEFVVNNYGAVTEGPQATWTTFTANGSGVLTYTSATDSHATGTFSFVAPAISSSGASGVRTVTDGRFDVRF